MHVLAVRFELRLPHCHSLKEKRAVVKPILEGARLRYRVASAEVDHHDSWQRTSLGMAAVGESASHVTEVVDAVERFVWSFPEVEVIDAERTWTDSLGGIGA